MAGYLGGRRIVVSGCSSGNGLGAVQRMVEAGANVVGSSRRMRQELTVRILEKSDKLGGNTNIVAL